MTMTERPERASAWEEAREAAGGAAIDRFLGDLAERVGVHAGVQAVFGEPIDRGDLTVIPVARVRWGFGGGAGSGTDGMANAGAGVGGGGGVTADPLGHLEIRGGAATFQPITSLYPSPWFLLAAGAMAALVIRALARLFRG